jgi:sarcosine oxidase
VIGAGVAGSAAARTLAERGVETVLFEQFTAGHTRGSSHGPTRMFRVAYPDPDYVRLAQRALLSWRALEDAAGEPLLVRTGGVYGGGWAEDCGAALADARVSRQWLSPEEATERFPALSFEGLERVLYQEDGGVCLADLTVAAQLRLARAAGAEIREETEVEHFVVDDEGIAVTTPAETVHAPVAVVAAGGWAADLLFEIGIDLPLRPSFAQVSYFAPANDEAPLPPCFIEADRGPGGLGSGGYVVPAVHGWREIKAADGTPGRTLRPELGPFPVDPALLANDVEFVRMRLPGFDAKPLRSETCLYTMTPDEDFVLERVGPVVIGSACSGHGFKFGPLLGEILADLAMERDPRLPAGRFSIGRAGLGAG